MQDDPITTPAPEHRNRTIHICGRPGAFDRQPLCAGHPITWGTLTQGTSLHGAPYPFPIFTDPSP